MFRFLGICAFILCFGFNTPVAHSAERVSIQLKWHHQFQFAGYYIALEKGFYREAGLDVTLLEGGPKQSSIQSLLAGKAQYAVESSSALLSYLEGDPILCLGVYFQHSPTVLIYKKNSGITNLRDLAGKRVSFTTTLTTELFAMLGQDGLRDTDFKAIQIRNEHQSIQALIDGTVDAIAGYSTNEPLTLRNMGIDIGTFSPILHGIDFYGDGLFTTNQEAEEHFERVQKVTAATNRGWEYAMSHPGEAIQIILRKYAPDKTREQLLFEMQVIRKLMLPHLVPVGSMSAKRWKDIAGVYIAQGLVTDTRTNLGDFVFIPEERTHTKLRQSLIAGTVLFVVAVLTLVALAWRNKRLRRGLKSRDEAVKDQENTLQTLLSVSPVALLHAKDRTVEWANPAAFDTFGYTQDEFFGLNSTALYPTNSEYTEVGKAVQQGLLERATISIDTTMTRKDGSRFIAHMSIRHLDLSTPERGYIVAVMDITNRKEAEEALRSSEERFRAFFQLAPYGAAVLDLEAVEYVDVNKEFCRQTGYTPEELKGNSPNNLNLIADPNYQNTHIAKLMAEGTLDNAQTLFRRKSGELRDIMHSCALLPLEGHPRALVVTNDITEQNEAQRRMRLSAQVFEQSRDSIVITDPRGRIVDLNKTFTKLSGYSRAEAIGNTPRMLKSGRHGQKYYKELWGALLKEGNWQGEIWNRKKDGEVFPCWLRISAVLDHTGKLINYVGTFSDLTQEKESAESIYRLNNYDLLTGLPNRPLFMNLIEQEMAHGTSRNNGLAVLAMDLDNFKTVNESLGISSGDEVLQETARRLSNLGLEGAITARLGSDEFAMLVPDMEKAEDASRIIEQVQQAMTPPFVLPQGEIYLTISTGVSLYPADAAEPQQLLRNAENALHFAHAEGLGSYAFFSTEMTERASERMIMGQALRQAVDNEEFVLFYQPKVELATGRILGSEALIRWQHPEMGLVPPGRFIPLVEESDLIHPVGEWVLEEACKACVRMNEVATNPMHVAVNLSPRQFHEKDIVKTVGDIIQKTGVNPSLLELEITEAVLVKDVETVTQTMHELKALGVSLAIDDFGTGYSSLQYLSTFPLDTLKIDRSFIFTMHTDPRNAAITSAVIAMANSLGLSVVAEGVEYEEHAQMLSQLGCMTAQGFFYSKPEPEESFDQLITSQSPFQPY